MKPRTRWLIGCILTLAIIVCGMFAGTIVGGWLLVAPGSGLAGPAAAIGYGLVGAAVGAVAAILLAIFLPPHWLTGVTISLFLVAAVLLALAGRGYLRSAAQTEADLNAAYERLPAFTVTIAYPDTADRRPFLRFEADWPNRRMSATTQGGDTRACPVELTGPDAVKLLGALRGVEGLLLKQPDPCSGHAGVVDHRLAFFINEVKPPDNEGDLTVTVSCLSAFPTLGAPAHAATEIVGRVRFPAECD